MKVHFLTVDVAHEGQRLDNFLRTRYKALPKSRLYRLIRKGEVRVNKKRVDPDYKIQGGDLVRMPPLKEESASTPKIVSVPEALRCQLQEAVLYEDKHLLVLNKPSGLSVHGGSGIKLGMIEALRLMYPQEKFLELAHRLDRETSGCLLFVKRPSILKEVHALLRENKVTKKYNCLVKGKWPLSLKKVNNALEGKPSLTLFKVVQHFKQTTLLEASLETGRNHQIRLHTAQMKYPIVGDEKYGDKDFNKLMRAYGCERLFLHAALLSFTLGEKNYEIEAPLEKRLKKTLDRLGK
jgi:23S rRNA pseudouridine955/2504/2580 synthase